MSARRERVPLSGRSNQNAAQLAVAKPNSARVAPGAPLSGRGGVRSNDGPQYSARSSARSQQAHSSVSHCPCQSSFLFLWLLQGLDMT